MRSARSDPVDTASELPYQAMFDASPLPASVSRLSDGKLLAVNSAWLAATGLQREAVLGRTTVELGHWPSEAARQAYVAGMADKPTYQVVCLKAGEWHRVRLSSCILDVQPEPLLLVYLSEITREHQVEQSVVQLNLSLQQQVELHGAMERLARVGHWTGGGDGRTELWSAGMYRLAGLDTGRDIVCQLWRDSIHPDDFSAWLEARKAMDGRVVEFRWHRPDGQRIWLRTRMGRTAVDGSTQTDFGVLQDVTHEKQAAQTTADQLTFIQSITEQVPGMLFQARLHPDGSFSFPFLSAAAFEMLEMDRSALQRDSHLFLSRVHPEDHRALLASMQQSSRDLVFWRQLFRVVLPRQGVRWYSVDALPQREVDGSTFWHGFCHDVTEARVAAHALERQHRLLEAVQQAQAAFIEQDDKRQAFETLLAALLEVTDSEFGVVGEVLFDMREQPYLKALAGANPARDDKLRQMQDEVNEVGNGWGQALDFVGRALHTKETLIANNLSPDPSLEAQDAGTPVLTAFVGIPLALGDHLVAMVFLANRQGGYGPADLDLLQPLLSTVRQLVMAWRGHAERHRSRLQFEATSALLADKSAALQVTFESMSQGLIMVDAAGRVRFFNRRFLEILDLPESLLESQPEHREVVAFQIRRGDFGENFSLIDPALRPYLGQNPPVMPPEVYLRRTTDGRVIEICSRLLPKGGMVRTYTDVTSYVKAEQALRDERQRLAWVLEATRPGIWEVNLETGAMVINERWAEMLGYSLEELQPTTIDTCRSLLHPLDRERSDRVLQWHLGGELPYYECDVRMRHKDGRWVWVNDRGRVHRRSEAGEALYMSGTHLDIDERVAAQEQVRALNASLEQRVSERTEALERSMKDMEAISYSIAHDLRAPLRSVNGFAALIAEEEGARLSPLASDMFGRIARSSRSMGQMITDMLELLRVVRVDLERVPVDMSALAQSVLEALAPDVPHAHIQQAPLPFVMGDAILLRQVLVNLLDNALKYSRHLDQPELLLGFDNAKKAFFVRDNGMGFNMGHAEKLFGLFQRLHAGTDVPGTGVGLAIVARIIERHGGRIWAESSPDEGATFWWTLPQS